MDWLTLIIPFVTFALGNLTHWLKGRWFPVGDRRCPRCLKGWMRFAGKTEEFEGYPYANPSKYSYEELEALDRNPVKTYEIWECSIAKHKCGYIEKHIPDPTLQRNI